MRIHIFQNVILLVLTMKTTIKCVISNQKLIQIVVFYHSIEKSCTNIQKLQCTMIYWTRIFIYSISGFAISSIPTGKCSLILAFQKIRGQTKHLNPEVQTHLINIRLSLFHVRRISTIKGELIPYLVKKQFSINSNQIGKSVSNEVDDTPNPRLHLQNREATSKGMF